MCRRLVVINQSHSRQILRSTNIISLVGSSPLLGSGGTLLIDRTLATWLLHGFRAASMSCFAQLRTAVAAAQFRPTIATRRSARANRPSDTHVGSRRDEDERKDFAGRSKHGNFSRFETRFHHLARTHIRQARFFSDSDQSTRPRSFTSSAAWTVPARGRFVVGRVRLGRCPAARRSQDHHDDEKNTPMKYAFEHRFTS